MNGPVVLNDAEEQEVKLWAADDRLWTTQETVEFNLRTFARSILSSDTRLAAAEQARDEALKDAERVKDMRQRAQSSPQTETTK